ncbi:hypothetical protein [Jiella sonneratiae]|uniref:Uncharacterized protein n=1 Tax=Jiella sonneratiae TaxID=2816856 RepID=A0ABS3IY57_9HYPH|nr:hypothetical protein [Jiella sonneratiae]MBO0902319.1 hypothetical protein [Jiella sonneratiae]
MIRQALHAAAILTLLTASGCAGSDSARALSLSPAPLPGTPETPLATPAASAQADAGTGLSGPTSDAAPAAEPFQTASIEARPSAAEITYANATAAGIFRRRKAERATTFLPAGTVDGYGLCLRAPARSGKGYDYALILLQNRLSGGAISQVDDETPVMRRPADAAPCARASLGWTRAG